MHAPGEKRKREKADKEKAKTTPPEKPEDEEYDGEPWEDDGEWCEDSDHEYEM